MRWVGRALGPLFVTALGGCQLLFGYEELTATKTVLVGFDEDVRVIDLAFDGERVAAWLRSPSGESTVSRLDVQRGAAAETIPFSAEQTGLLGAYSQYQLIADRTCVYLVDEEGIAAFSVGGEDEPARRADILPGAWAAIGGAFDRRLWILDEIGLSTVDVDDGTRTEVASNASFLCPAHFDDHDAYFTTGCEPSSPTLWTVRASGGRATPLTQDPGGFAAIDTDDAYVYWSGVRYDALNGEASLRRMPRGGGLEEIVYDGSLDLKSFAVTSRSIFLATMTGRLFRLPKQADAAPAHVDTAPIVYVDRMLATPSGLLVAGWRSAPDVENTGASAPEAIVFLED